MKAKFLNAFVIVLILFQAVAPVGVLAYTSTDQSDYAPGATVYISGDNSDGAGFVADESVLVEVSGPNGFAASCTAIADSNAAWTCALILPADAPDGGYSYSATGAISLASQSGGFTVTAPAPPAADPTQEPTLEPTAEPTTAPTTEPTQAPTAEPTSEPAVEPTAAPTQESTAEPTAEPAAEPTATVPTAPPFIQSDKEDYYMGETVILTGGNWQPGETIQLFVNDDAVEQTWSHAVGVQSDGSGAFVYPFQLPNWYVAVYRVTALGTDSGAVSTTFTDSPKVGSVSVGAQSPSPVSTGSNATYTITVNRGTGGGSSGAFNANLTVTPALPSGISASFSPSPVEFRPSDTSKTSTLTISVGCAAPAGTTNFTVRAATSATDFATTTSSINVSKVICATNLAVASASGTYGGTTNLQATLTRGPSAISGKTINFTLNGSSIGTAVTDASGVATLSGASLAGINVGTYPAGVAASFAGDTDYSASSGSASLTVNKANQTISFGALANKTFGDADFTVGATASSGLAVTFTSTGNCTVLVDLVQITGAGSCTITAYQAGNANYNAAPEVSQSFAIGKATPTITWSDPADIAYGTALSGTQLNATASVAGSFVYTPDSGTVLSAGPHTLHVDFTPTDTANYSNASKDVTINVSKADAACTVTGFTGFYDGDPHGASGTCTGVGGPSDVLSGLDLGSSFTNVPGGTANWSFSNPNYNNQSGSVDIVINKADATCTVDPYSVTYDGNAHTSTGSCTGVNNESLSGLDLSSTTHIAAGDYLADVWTFTDVTGNYNDANGTVHNSIGKADATCTISGYSGAYDALAHGATGSCVGIGGEDAGTLDLGDSFTNVPGGIAYWSFTGNGNYNDQNDSVAIVITKADATCAVDGWSGTYDGDPHGAIGSCTGIGGVTLTGLDLGDSFTDVPGGTASWSFSNSNYNQQNGSVAIVITKANALCSVNGYTGIYDGDPHGASGSCTGVGGVMLSGLDLGESFTDVPGGTANWSFSNPNYNDQNGTASIVITKAEAVCDVEGYTGVYDGDAHGASGSCTGIGGIILSGLDLGDSFTNVPGGVASWSFSNPNYSDQNGTASIVISKADAVCDVDGYTGIYDGDPHGATGSCTGVMDEDLSGDLGLGASFTDVPGGTANWTFADTTGNYNDQSGTASIVIENATAACSVTGYTGVYDALAHGATGSCTGVGGADLSTGLDLGDSFTNVPGGTADWSFSYPNYNDQNGSVDIVITKADAVCEVNGYTGVYDALAHGASGSCTGIGGVTLSGLNLGASFTNVPGGTASWSFSNSNYSSESGSVEIVITKADADCSVDAYDVTYDAVAHTSTGSCIGVDGEELDGLDLSGTTHTDAGSYTDSWSFIDVTGNYNDNSGTVANNIDQADASCLVTGYTGVYDAQSHGASGSCSGVGGVDLSSSLNLGASFTDVPGGTAHWTFEGGTNYLDESGSVTIDISKADVECTVTPYDVTYDAMAHTATGSCVGVVGEMLTGLDLSGTTHTAAGTYDDDPWTFTDVTGNYNDTSGTVDNNIDKADAVCSVTPYDVTYDSFAHTATGSCLGVLGEALAGLDLSGTTHTNAGVYIDDPWTFSDVTGNYNNTSGTVDDNIDKADAVCTVSTYGVTYDGDSHTATGSCLGVLGETLVGLDLSATTHTNAGVYIDDPWTFTDVTGNYNDTSGTVDNNIDKADAACTVTGYHVTYDGDPHTATGECLGVLSESLVGLDLSGTTHTNAGVYNDDSWTFTDVTGNYNNASGTVDNNIDKADAACTVSGYDVIYNALAHTATGECLGVNDEVLAGLDLAGTTHTNAGSYMDNWTFTDQTGNYNDTSGTVENNIEPAPLTITAHNKSVAEGASWPAFDVAYDGFVLGEGPSVLGGTLVCTSTAPNPTTDNGTFQINCSGLTSSNYSITDQPGTLTVTNVDPTAIFAATSPINEGTSSTLSFTGASDPGSVDTATGFHYSFACDGLAASLAATYAAAGVSSSANCAFDDNGTYTVMGRIFDKDDGSSTYTATVTVNNVAPTAVLANNGPVNEAGPANVSFSSQFDPSDADTTAGFHYAFSCTNGDLSGATYVGSSTSSSTTCTFDDNGTYTVRGRILDKDGDYTEYTTAVTVNNVAPTATFVNNGPVNEGSSFILSLTSPMDPSTADTTAGFQYAFDCGDGSGYGLFGSSNFASCSTTDNGTRAVKGKIKDKDGGVTEYTGSVVVNNVAPTLSTPSLTGNTATACIAGNSVNLSFTFTDPGSADTFTGTINWGDGSSTTSFTSSPVNVSHTYAAGIYNITVTVNDDDGGSDTRTVSNAVSLLYTTSGILQPINLTGPRSSFKIGSTIPVKLRVTDCNGSPVSGLILTVHLAQTDPTAGDVNELVSTSAADSGILMRFTGAPDNQYMFNLSTKRSQFNAGQDLTTGTYHIWITGPSIAPVHAYFDARR